MYFAPVLFTLRVGDPAVFALVNFTQISAPVFSVNPVADTTLAEVEDADEHVPYKTALPDNMAGEGVQDHSIDQSAAVPQSNTIVSLLSSTVSGRV